MKITIFLCLLAMSAGIASAQRLVRDDLTIGETMQINMYGSIKAIEVNSVDVFLDYCPMRKASWMSETKEIKNSYYGKKMLDCGYVKATLKPQPAN